MDESRHIAIALEFNQPYARHAKLIEGVTRFVNDQPGWTYAIDEHPGLRMSGRKPYDGVIARASHTMQRRLKRLGIPFVNVQLENHRPGVAGVYVDGYRGGWMACEHLIQRGFRRLAVMVNPEHEYPQAIMRGFADRAEEDGFSYKAYDLADPNLLDRKSWFMMEEQCQAFMSELEPQTGLLVDKIGGARLLVQMALVQGKRVPQDLAVVSHEANETLAMMDPQITTLDFNFHEIGQESCRLLEKLMNGEPNPDRPLMVPPSQVAVRESTDFFAVQDEVVAEALRYISIHLHEKLRIEKIAYEINVSTRKLQQRFSDAVGVPISDEIRRLRLEKAKRLLTDPQRTIGSIPKEVGFTNAVIMNHIFKRELGMTPSVYRKRLQSAKSTH